MNLRGLKVKTSIPLSLIARKSEGRGLELPARVVIHVPRKETPNERHVIRRERRRRYRESIQRKLAQLVGFGQLAAVLDEGVLHGEVDADLSLIFVVEVAVELLQLVVVSVVVVFEARNFGLGDLQLLAPDELHCVGVLVAAGVDVAIFIRQERTLDDDFGCSGSSGCSSPLQDAHSEEGNKAEAETHSVD